MIRNRPIERVLNTVGGAAIVVGVRIRGIELYSLRVVVDRSVDIARGAVGNGAAVVGPRELGVDFDRMGVVGDRPIVLTLVIVDEAAPVLRAGEKRIDCNCFGEISNRRVEFTRLAIDVAAVEKGDSILRVAPYELGAVWDRIFAGSAVASCRWIRERRIASCTNDARQNGADHCAPARVHGSIGLPDLLGVEARTA